MRARRPSSVLAGLRDHGYIAAMRRTRRTFSSAPLLVVAFFAGCYTYAPIQPAAARPGMSVRARVTAVESERLAPLLATTDPRVFTGRLIDTAEASMVVEVPIMVQAGVGASFQTLHQRISIPSAAVVEFEARKLDRVRTGLLVGATAVVAAAILKHAFDGGPGLDRPPGGSSTDSRRPPRGTP